MAEPFVWALTDPELVRQQITDYFNSLPIMAYRKVYDPDLKDEVRKNIQIDTKMPGVAGLAYAIGINRMSLLKYCKITKEEQQEREGLESIVRDLLRAKSRIELFQEQGLFDKVRHRGSMFSLAVNYKWRDGESDAEGTGEGFVQNILPPAQSQTAKAIPKWEPEE